MQPVRLRLRRLTGDVRQTVRSGAHGRRDDSTLGEEILHQAARRIDMIIIYMNTSRAQAFCEGHLHSGQSTSADLLRGRALTPASIGKHMHTCER